MKKLDTAKTIGIVANLGVLVGIFLLAYELHQNRQMMQAQMRDSVAQALATMLHEDSLSAEMQSITTRAFAGETLDPVERNQFLQNWSAYLRLWENMHYQYRLGLFSDAEMAAEQESWKRFYRR